MFLQLFPVHIENLRTMQMDANSCVAQSNDMHRHIRSKAGLSKLLLVSSRHGQVVVIVSLLGNSGVPDLAPLKQARAYG